jgi:hypothetical protein
MNTQIRDNLFSAEEIHSDKGYTLSTLEKQQEFADKRNYPWNGVSPSVNQQWTIKEEENAKRS